MDLKGACTCHALHTSMEQLACMWILAPAAMRTDNGIDAERAVRRVGWQAPEVTIRFEGLSAQADAFLASHARPSILNFYQEWVVVRLSPRLIMHTRCLTDSNCMLWVAWCLDTLCNTDPVVMPCAP